MHTNTGLNKVLLVGYIAQQPELYKHPDKKQQISFTLTTFEVIKTSSGQYEHAETHYIKIDADNASISKLSLQKGDHIYVHGKIHTSHYVDERQIKR
jgi:single-stranded DNA-binding protein